MKNNIYNHIARIAFDYARVAPEEVIDIRMSQDGALIEVDFFTEWMSYICYVDLGGAVIGFFSEPVTEHETDCITQFIREPGCCA